MFKVTRREVLASVSIVAILLLIGFFVSGKISEYQMDKNEIYNKSAKINNQDIFEYGMKTNIGNAFVYGDLKAVDTVTYPEIGGNYMCVEKVKERYTMHTRTVVRTTGSGKTYTEVETYWEWDRVGSEKKTCKEVLFCGTVFSSSKIDIPDPIYIDTVKESSLIRYKYYGTSTELTGTIFTRLENNTISEKTQFYKDMDIEETVNHLKFSWVIIVFWIVWIILICACVLGFYFIDNKWLEH